MITHVKTIIEDLLPLLPTKKHSYWQLSVISSKEGAPMCQLHCYRKGKLIQTLPEATYLTARQSTWYFGGLLNERKAHKNG